ncbi:hypothetical protein D3C81_1916490 [compost metagenome]
MVLLLGVERRTRQVGVEGAVQVVGFSLFTGFKLAEELLEVAWLGAVEGLDDRGGLLLRKVGLGRLGEQADAGQQQGSGSELFQMHGCAHSFAGQCQWDARRETGRCPR